MEAERSETAGRQQKDIRLSRQSHRSENCTKQNPLSGIIAYTAQIAPQKKSTTTLRYTELPMNIHGWSEMKVFHHWKFNNVGISLHPIMTKYWKKYLYFFNSVPLHSAQCYSLCILVRIISIQKKLLSVPNDESDSALTTTLPVFKGNIWQKSIYLYIFINYQL